MNEGRIRSFRDLDAWRVGTELAVLVYRLAARLPPEERYELNAQMRRAAVSIPSNVAEGQACGEDGRYIHHLRLRVAIGSLGELATQLELARRLHLLPEPDLGPVEACVARSGQLLHGLLRSRLLKRRRALAGASALLAALALALNGLTVLR